MTNRDPSHPGGSRPARTVRRILLADQLRVFALLFLLIPIYALLQGLLAPAPAQNNQAATANPIRVVAEVPVEVQVPVDRVVEQIIFVAISEQVSPGGDAVLPDSEPGITAELLSQTEADFFEPVAGPAPLPSPLADEANAPGSMPPSPARDIEAVTLPAGGGQGPHSSNPGPTSTPRPSSSFTQWPARSTALIAVAQASPSVAASVVPDLPEPADWDGDGSSRQAIEPPIAVLLDRSTEPRLNGLVDERDIDRREPARNLAGRGPMAAQLEEHGQGQGPGPKPADGGAGAGSPRVAQKPARETTPDIPGRSAPAQRQELHSNSSSGANIVTLASERPSLLDRAAAAPLPSGSRDPTAGRKNAGKLDSARDPVLPGGSGSTGPRGTKPRSNSRPG